ncbi:MAG: amino acid adenylation domain-containing protein, partial [Myxococcales bacterium]|nr:amino acid adenylation domain-containing protein [Myxococcales bacterium]
CPVLVVDGSDPRGAALDHTEPGSLASARAASDIVLVTSAAGLRCDFATDVLDRTSAGYVLDQIIAVARQGLAERQRPVDSFVLIGEAERRRLLPPSPPPRTDRPLRLHQIIAERARETPEAVAVRCADEELTYGELEAWAETVAADLRQRGVGRGDRVGIELERSLALVVAMLGAWKAGAAYVPIDPRVPLVRRREVLELAEPRVLVTHDVAAWATDRWPCMQMPARSTVHAGGAVPEVAGDEPGNEDDAAYVLFTSGSTGRPKGVEVSHRNVVRLFTTTHPLFEFRAGDTWLNAHNITFDASVWEIYGALLTGGRVVIAPRETTRDPRAMVDLVHAERVSMVTISPTAFDGFRDAALERDEQFAALRHVVLCAEALSPAALGAWFERWGDEQPALVNMYGITETTVHSTHHRLTEADARDPRRKIGAGLPDTPIYVLDAHGALVPFGAVGEIFVGGPGVSLGYLGAPPAHAHRFSDDPFVALPGARRYRSGDLARRLPDGTLEYLGRLDKQVKIRGHRVELGEVE